MKQEKLIKDLIKNEEKFLLIILDACRYDYFKKLNTIKGNLIKVESPGSATGEWLNKVWTDYYKIAYVSANPNIALNWRSNSGWSGKEHFEYIDEVWNWGWKTIEQIPTVPAEEVVKGIEKTIKKGHNKIIAHFMQPHPPYIGKKKLGVGTFIYCRYAALENKKSRGDIQPYVMLIEPVLKQAYRDNLLYVIEKGIKPILKYKKDFKIIISADHGERLFENGKIGHGDGIKVKELINVPWFEVC